jgi:hypothetical protein
MVNSEGILFENQQIVREKKANRFPQQIRKHGETANLQTPGRLNRTNDPVWQGRTRKIEGTGCKFKSRNGKKLTKLLTYFKFSLSC